MRLNGRFLGKTSLTKNLKMISGGGWGGGGVGGKTGVFQPVFRDLCSTGKKNRKYLNLKITTKNLLQKGASDTITSPNCLIFHPNNLCTNLKETS